MIFIFIIIACNTYLLRFFNGTNTMHLTPAVAATNVLKRCFAALAQLM